jgi:hypothetical protein
VHLTLAWNRNHLSSLYLIECLLVTVH